MLVALAWLLPSCSAPAPVPVERREAAAVVLSGLAFAELALPGDSRGGTPPPERIPVNGPWRRLGRNTHGLVQFAAALPVRPRGQFFERPEPGIRAFANDLEIPYDPAGIEPAWSHDRAELSVFLPSGVDPPTLTLEWPLATERERALNLKWSGHTATAFAWTTIQDADDSRTGLLLPAPARAVWDVTVPPAGELRFAAGLVEPEIRDGPQSDGASLVVAVDGEEIDRENLAIHGFHDRSVDLSRWAGRTVRLAIATEPGPSASADYAFVGAPIVGSRVRDPRRILLVFVDTLRPDHLSLYGYRRDTSAAIDHLASEAAIFSRAHTVAPWTLPSARTVVTGRYPESYDAADTLPGMLHRAGWSTAFFAGNVYLTAAFGMNRDWDLERVALLPEAAQTTDDALAWLDAHGGQDALLEVHYMSTHLPYLEPPSYRTRYAAPGPVEGLGGEIQLRQVSGQLGPEGRQYLQDRYDGTIRYTTDQIERLLARLGPDDAVILFADHGEEFWDHGGFEHGHTLYEELVHVPLVVKAPGAVAGRIDAPVSLLDVTPTVLDLAGVEIPGDLPGHSVLPLVRGEAGAAAAFAGRDLALGHPLYGPDRWGVLHGSEKWTTIAGQEQVVDLVADPAEVRPIPADGEWSSRLAAAVGRSVPSAWRLAAASGAPLAATCQSSGGFSAVFPADDPLAIGPVVVEGAGDTARICWGAGPREIYLVSASGSAIRCDVAGQALGPEPGRVTVGGRDVELTRGISPVPAKGTTPISAADGEMRGMLAALGYLTAEPGGAVRCDGLSAP